MDKLKQWVALSLVAVLAVLGAGWFLLVSPKRADAAALREEAVTQQQSNDQLRTQIASLKAQSKDLPKEQAKLAAVAAKLPDNAAQPALLRALAAAATGAGVEFVSITPGAPAAVAAATGKPVAAAGGDTASTPTASGSAGGSSAGAGQLQSMPLTISAFGSYFDLQAYLAALEDLPRALRVTAVTLAPGANPVGAQAAAGTAAAPTDDGQHLVATITAEVFIAAGAAPAVPVVAPVAAPAQQESR